MGGAGALELQPPGHVVEGVFWRGGFGLKVGVRRSAGGMDRLGAEQFEAHAAENVGEGVAIILVSHADADAHEGQSRRGVVGGIGALAVLLLHLRAQRGIVDVSLLAAMVSLSFAGRVVHGILVNRFRSGCRNRRFTTGESAALARIGAPAGVGDVPVGLRANVRILGELRIALRLALRMRAITSVAELPISRP